ncbi:MAG: ThiF family adenylyltransferase [Proteobacteria bacterium]|nr:ThiF family adenylyltransferase [Pseudomonadota bacterium]
MRVVIVGAGGLGGPIALALARAPVELTIVDPDRVELSNLHRQVQFSDADVGAAKATRLAARVGGVGIVGRWTAPDQALAGDLIVDASDDPATKFAIADHAVATRRPYVIASALRYGGNVMVGAPGAACYRCLFEDVPDEVPSCAAAGVLGPVVGVIGGLAAALALRLVANDRRDAGSIYVVDDARVDHAPRVVRFARRAGCTCRSS